MESHEVQHHHCIQKQQHLLLSEPLMLNEKNFPSCVTATQIQQKLASPEEYQLNQSLFTKEELVGQAGYLVQEDKESLYFGGSYHNMKHGYGVLLTKNTVYQGCFSLDFKMGKGYQKFANGSIYFGDFQNGKTHGEGYLRFNQEVYMGEFQNGSMQGDGLWKNKNGEKYIGEWKSNKAHGFGVYITRSSHYQGQFVKFTKSGKGEEHFANGDSYQGEYVNGKPNGEGKYQWKSGAKYEGQFLDGKRHGKGKWLNEKADTYEGEYRNDKRNGFGEYKWADGNVYIGNFVNDVRTGGGEMFWADGSTYKGEWLKGALHGRGLYKAKGSSPKQGLFQDNLLVEENSQHQRKHIGSSHRESLILAMIPQLTNKRKIYNFSQNSSKQSQYISTKSSRSNWLTPRK